MRKVLGVFFIVLALITGLAAVVGWTLRTTVLGTSAPVKAALQNGRVYDRVLTEVLPAYVADPSKVGDFYANVPLTPTEVTTIVQESLTSTFLQTNIEHVLDIVYDLAYGRTTLTNIDFVISLEDLKRRFPVAVHDTLIAKLKALPVCKTSQQLATYSKRSGLEGVLPPCLPSGVSAQSLVDQAGGLQDALDKLPASIDVGEKLRASSGNSDAAAKLALVAEKFSFVRQLHTYLTLLVAVLLLATGFLFAPRWRRVLQWFGAALLVVGGIVIAGTIVGWTFVPDSIHVSDALTKVVIQVVEPVGRSLLARVYHQQLFVAGGLAALGILAILGSFFVPDRPLKK